MTGHRIVPVICPECGLRARVHERLSGTPEHSVDDNTATAGITQLRRSYDPVRLPPRPPP